MEYKLSSFQFSKDIERDDKHHAIQKINELRPVCPYDSKFTGSFEKNKDKFSGEIKIHFSKGQFIATGTSGTMKQLMLHLNSKLIKQIDMWKAVRFDQEETFIDFDKKVGN